MEEPARHPRSLATLVVVLTAAALACAGFMALGVWQVERLAWKEALIARVQRHVAAAPVAAPGPAQWPALRVDDEYLRITAHGRFDYGREVLVGASTELGPGYWVLTPLRTDAGWWLLVDRGFIPSGLRSSVPHAAPEQTITGLLRPTEPGGRFLLHNDPQAGRWYSRDVAAIAQRQGLVGPVAPYFVDVQAQPAAAPTWPRAGLTVLQFPNNHLAYALTWFALAALTVVAAGYVLRDARRQRSRAEGSGLADPKP